MSQVKQVEFTLQTNTEEKGELIHLDLKIAEENANYLVHRALITQEKNLQQFSANTKTFFISIVILFVLYFDKELQISQLRFSFIEYPPLPRPEH